MIAKPSRRVKLSDIRKEYEVSIHKVLVYFGVSWKDVTMPHDRSNMANTHIRYAKYMLSALLKYVGYSLHFCNRVFRCSASGGWCVDRMLENKCLKKFYNDLIYGEEKAIY